MFKNIFDARITICTLLLTIISNFVKSFQENPFPLHIAVEVDQYCDEHCAKQIAKENDMTVLNSIGDLPGWYIFSLSESMRESCTKGVGVAPDVHQCGALPQIQHHRVVQQIPQYPVQRSKRDGKVVDANGQDLKLDFGSESSGGEAQNGTNSSKLRRSKTTRKLKDAAINEQWNDPMWPDQWYLHHGVKGGYDLGVVAVWKMGYTGRGVVISIVDDGLQGDHEDLAQNYDPEASYDFNFHKADPTPRNNRDNDHGTLCAGTIAMVAGNNLCGVGIAYNASVGGLKILDGKVTDAMEAAALSFNLQHVHMYTGSWGPTDDGKSAGGPKPIVRKAMERGVEMGRGGKGSIYVWASGNGGYYGDACSVDLFASSMHTLSISSVTSRNTPPSYGEQCPSSLASVYVDTMPNGMVTVQVPGPVACSEHFSGTSAAAPMAAAIMALALEANRNLTYRDMKHLVLRTSSAEALRNNSGWITNGAGRRVNTKFGYGLMNAEALVKAAEKWVTVPEVQYCEITPQLTQKTKIKGGERVEFEIEASDCNGTVRYLEHVAAKVSAKFSERGSIQLSLTSPSGTHCVLLHPRHLDTAKSGFHDWPFISIHTWGEHPSGVWRLTVENVGNDTQMGTFIGWSLLLQGTSTPAQPTDPENSPGGKQSAVHAASVWQILQVQPHVSPCHPECTAHGCYEPNSDKACVKCRHFAVVLSHNFWDDANLVQWHSRHAAVRAASVGNFKCSATCPATHYIERATVTGGICRPCARICRTCAHSAESCTSCPVYVNETDNSTEEARDKLITQNGRSGEDKFGISVIFRKGQCVEKCPKGWILKEFQNTLGEKSLSCEPASSPCGSGFYFNIRFMKCMHCSEACASECGGPSEFDCMGAQPCAEGFIWHVDKCVRCCDGRGTADDCAKCAVVQPHSFVSPAAFVASLLALAAMAAFLCYWQRGNRRGYESLS